MRGKSSERMRTLGSIWPYFFFWIAIAVVVPKNLFHPSKYPSSPYDTRKTNRPLAAQLEEHDSISIYEPWMKKPVEFWIDVFSKYSSHQVIIHDSKYVQVVYEVLDLKGHSSRQRRKKIKAAKEKWEITLRSLIGIQKNAPHLNLLNADQRRVFELFSEIDQPNKYLEASRPRRVRAQSGHRDRFKRAIESSWVFLPMMERVFEEEGVPKKLTRLPFVESSFHTSAQSYVGAVGIWQFMKSTGKNFLHIGSAVDERYDPERATRAAARLLKRNYDSLQSWPLAIIAYNHGRKGMMRAVAQVGSRDLESIVKGYRSRTFGFAGKNYFFELLAAIEIEKYSEFYFGIEPQYQPWPETVEVGLAHSIRAPILWKYMKLNPRQFKKLNPAVKKAALRGKKRIPAGFTVRVPPEWGKAYGGPREAFWKKYQKIPKGHKFRAPRAQRYAKDP